MVKTYAPGFALIGALVALAFQINQIQSAISPLALCVAFGFIVANFIQWPAFAGPATKLSSKTIMRIGVALLGAQVSAGKTSIDPVIVCRHCRKSSVGHHCGKHDSFN